MPFCPKCGIEYRLGFTRCSDCDVDLVESLENQPAMDGDYVILGSWEHPVELREVCEILGESGIPCITQGAEAKRIVGIHSAQGGQVLVPSNRLEEAREMVQVYFSDNPSDKEIEFHECSECGCPVDPEDEVCPACGEKLTSGE